MKTLTKVLGTGLLAGALNKKLAALCLVLGLLIVLFFSVEISPRLLTLAAPLLALLVMSGMVGICIPVGSIPEFCGSNPGGQYSFYVIRAVDVQSIPAPAVEGDMVITGAIVPKPGKAFAKWEFAEDTSDLNVKAIGEAGNQAWEITASCYIPGSNPAIAKVMNSMLNQRCIIIVVDGKGQKRVGGTMQRGMMCTPDYSSGKVFTDKNGYTVTFKVGQANEPFFYEGEIPVVAVP